ncbi:YqaJ viral recombinase family protein [Halomonas sp. McH1-25]|uniref:YqaJ viral recombinase family nuclease n=1 Tax=unclassified Halomonas TaxID=2609666 RepID=UPI001EF52BE2|nr:MULTISPECIES: YqaJ viral recombinase family protein [unclassified Halomonas]MCG7598370.1 YqaJ viral recombinase family protein [Halomonas sp. McH1-25]MCP1342688.1 YqaJ viral recombinase family protein [Halomonas sp. FL8]MCP1363088.1 YqaJ viral recombinase family protein [Halomonas sp. BBD45]MCP1365575.1 YqaJ viral recombinase family protein [Halomonas sp. BBD48]
MILEEAKQELQANGRISTLGMPEDIWLELRGLGIGASEAAAAIGISEHRTPYEIAERKLSLAKDDDEANYRRQLKMAMGHVMEPVTASRFAEATGLTVQNYNAMVAHRDHPWMLANIDRRVVGVTEGQSVWLEGIFGQAVSGPGVIELKNVEFGQKWGKPDNVHATAGLCTSGEVPEDYFVQVQHQLAVMGYEWAFLVVTIAGWETRWYPILRDDALIEDIIELEGELWAGIQRGELPDIDVEHPKAIELLKRRYPGTDGSIVRLDSVAHWREEIEKADAEIKKNEGIKEVAKARLLETMGEAAVGVFSDGACFRRKVINKKAYTVEYQATSYLDFRAGKIGKAEKDQLAAQHNDTQGEAA